MKKSTAKIVLTIVMAIALAISVTGCAGFNNEIQANGSIIGSTSGSYVVTNYSGNTIMDVWVLKDAYVKSESGSDGWNFIDNDGNPEKIGGDAKIIRVKDRTTLSKYVEYHYEFDGGNYYSFLKAAKAKH